MNPPPDRGQDSERETRAPRDEQRHVVTLTRRVDAVATAVGQARDDVGAVAQDLRALRQEVQALRTGVEELLRYLRPVEVPPPQLEAEPPSTTRRTEVVYLTAGLAVAAVAVLLAIYLFTWT
jgi:hypothetical protein